MLSAGASGAAASGWLLLFDIDGTLVWRASAEHAQAVVEALHVVHGPQPLGEVDAAGRTDRHIVRQLLRGAGLPDPQIDAGMEALVAHAQERYEELCPSDLSHTVIDGIPAMLDELARWEHAHLALVTGNLKQVAERKLSAAGLHDHFVPVLGAFGSDHEDRDALVPIALERAGERHGLPAAWPAERAIVIGDTPHDIACARVAGAQVIGVTTGAYEAAALTEADVVVSDPAALLPALSALGVPTS